MIALLERIAYNTSGSHLEFGDYLKEVRKHAVRTRSALPSKADEQGAGEVGVSGEQGDRGQEAQDGQYQ